MSALNVASVSSAVLDHLACPYVSDTNVFTSCHFTLAIIARLNDKLPEALAPLATVTKPVENFTNEVNSVLVSFLDFVAPVSTKTKGQRNLIPGLLMKPKISSWPPVKWNEHGVNLNSGCQKTEMLGGCGQRARVAVF